MLRARNYVKPFHLRELIDELEKIQRGEEVRIVCHSPPRGAKSETLLASVSWFLDVHPDWEIGYFSYNATQARSKGARAREWAKAMGIPVVRNTLIEWRTPEGGGCVVRGVGEGITGQGLDVTIIDDPVKDRAEAESGLKRQRTLDWFNDAVYTRGNPSSVAHPRPRSIIVNMARWHDADLAGELIKQGWKYIRIPALADDGSSYWPEMWTPEKLEAIKRQIGDYSFASLYQGLPRPRGGTVFNDPTLYSPHKMPSRFRFAIGIDLAYSKKTSSDYSCAVVMMLDVVTKLIYVVEVLRRQMRAPEFMHVLKVLRMKYRRPPMRFYASGIEQGTADFFKAGGVPLEVVTVSSDKYTRAIPYAATWNAGNVMIPDTGLDYQAGQWVVAAEDDDVRDDWREKFIVEHATFTGINDKKDDQIDAAVAAHDLLNGIDEGAERFRALAKM